MLQIWATTYSTPIALVLTYAHDVDEARRLAAVELASKAPAGPEPVEVNTIPMGVPDRPRALFSQITVVP